MGDFDVIVIGQGYAGLKAARFAAARGLRTAVAERNFPGGLVMSINHLEPVPAGEEPSGPELTSTLAMENMDAGVETLEGAVTGLAQEAGGRWRVTTEGGSHAAANVIVATGARLRRLGVPGEEEHAGRGVSECADCDGPLYQGREAVVIGGGDSAFQEALALTAYAGQVTIVMRGSTPRAQPAFVAAVRDHPAIEVRADTQVTAILGDAAGVTGVTLTGAQPGDLPCAVVFVFVGLQPKADFLPADVTRDAAGAVVTDDDLRTGLPGLWAIGAVRSGYRGLMTDATAEAQHAVDAL